MRRFFGLQMVCGAVLAAAICFAGPDAATASDAYVHCRYAKVVTYRTEVVPYVKWVTVVDDYGCPRRVKKVCHRKVVTPVVTWVKVCE